MALHFGVILGGPENVGMPLIIQFSTDFVILNPNWVIGIEFGCQSVPGAFSGDPDFRPANRDFRAYRNYGLQTSVKIAQNLTDLYVKVHSSLDFNDTCFLRILFMNLFL